jgi:hypothetical protein
MRVIGLVLAWILSQVRIIFSDKDKNNLESNCHRGCFLIVVLDANDYQDFHFLAF